MKYKSFAQRLRRKNSSKVRSSNTLPRFSRIKKLSLVKSDELRTNFNKFRPK